MLHNAAQLCVQGPCHYIPVYFTQTTTLPCVHKQHKHKSHMWVYSHTLLLLHTLCQEGYPQGTWEALADMKLSLSPPPTARANLRQVC